MAEGEGVKVLVMEPAENLSHRLIFGESEHGSMATGSNSKPASRRCIIGRSISTGWLPVENFFPFAIVMFRCSVQITSTFRASPIAVLSYSSGR